MESGRMAVMGIPPPRVWPKGAAKLARGTSADHEFSYSGS